MVHNKSIAQNDKMRKLQLQNENIFILLTF